MQFHCANGLVVLRGCAPQREGSIEALLYVHLGIQIKWLWSLNIFAVSKVKP